jgi:hypothetical protein
MMWLQIESLKKVPHKVAHRETKSSLKMGNKDNILTGARYRSMFTAG